MYWGFFGKPNSQNCPFFQLELPILENGRPLDDPCPLLRIFTAHNKNNCRVKLKLLKQYEALFKFD